MPPVYRAGMLPKRPKTDPQGFPMPAKKPKPGTITWADLTVANVPKVRDFYAAVAGWKPSAVPMQGYSDYCMTAPGQRSPVAGVCHRRGTNNNIPGGWILYINVPDIDAAVRAITKFGGTIIGRIRGTKGKGRTVFFRDPSGAPGALHES